MTSDMQPNRVLYVEDEALVALAVTMALEDAGFVVEHVLSGKAALEVVEKTVAAYSILVTDVRLPELDGWSIARRARELNPHLPVVYMSGDSAINWSLEGVPRSIMVQKPCTTDALLATIGTLRGRPPP